MLTNIGNFAFNEINEENSPTKTLLSFDLKKVDIQKATRVFETGFQFYDIKIANSAKLEQNNTYLLRSVFEDKERASGFTKVDVIFAFRVLKIENEFVTLAWKKVSLKD